MNQIQLLWVITGIHVNAQRVAGEMAARQSTVCTLLRTIKNAGLTNNQGPVSPATSIWKDIAVNIVAKDTALFNALVLPFIRIAAWNPDAIVLRTSERSRRIAERKKS